MPQDAIVGRAEIADYLGCSEKTIGRLVRRGLLTVRKQRPFENAKLVALRNDLEKLKREFVDGQGGADE